MRFAMGDARGSRFFYDLSSVLHRHGSRILIPECLDPLSCTIIGSIIDGPSNYIPMFSSRQERDGKGVRRDEMELQT